MTTFKWGTVVSTGPVAVQLDGDSSPLAVEPDSLVDPLSLAVGHRVRVELSGRRAIIHGVANSGGFAAGDLVPTARATARPGFLMCDGASYLRVDYPALFDAIGTTYGAVDSAHFNVPNFKGRTLVGLDTSQTEFNTLGKTGGAKTHQLTVDEMPSHRHTVRVSGADDNNHTGNFDGVADSDAAEHTPARNTSYVGGGQPHNNLQPYIVTNLMIKT